MESTLLPDLRSLECAAFKVRRLARRVTQIYDEALAEQRLTIGQFGILSWIGRQRGVTISQLSEQLSIDASTLSRLGKPLISAGLVAIEPDPNDGRAKILRLTPAGRDRVAAAYPVWMAAQARVTGQLGEARLAALRFTLDDAFDHLN